MLLTDHSGRRRRALAPVAELRVADGRAVRTAIAPRGGVRIVASHPDGRRVDKLRADGWHVESVDDL